MYLFLNWKQNEHEEFCILLTAILLHFQYLIDFFIYIKQSMLIIKMLNWFFLNVLNSVKMNEKE